MQIYDIRVVSVAWQISCDRCEKAVQRGQPGFEEMRSIGFDAGDASIFGNGNRVDLDLCEACLRETLGAWLKVKTPADTPVKTMLAAFKSEGHGGELPAPEPGGS